LRQRKWTAEKGRESLRKEKTRTESLRIRKREGEKYGHDVRDGGRERVCERGKEQMEGERARHRREIEREIASGQSTKKKPKRGEGVCER